MKTLLTLSTLPPLAVVLALLGCEPPALETRTFALDNISGHEAAELIDPYVYRERDARFGGPGTYSTTTDAITIRETAENIERIARVLAEFDTARPDIQLRFRLIEADGYPERDPRIAEVEDELRRVFQFAGYRLAGEAVVTATSGAEISQGFAGSGGTYPKVNATVLDAGGGAVRLHEVTLWVSVRQTALQTTVNVRPGQTLVLGSAPQQGDSPTLLLTVTAEGGGGASDR